MGSNFTIPKGTAVKCMNCQYLSVFRDDISITFYTSVDFICYKCEVVSRYVPPLEGTPFVVSLPGSLVRALRHLTERSDGDG